MTKQHTPKQIIMVMVLHRITGMNSFCFNLFPALIVLGRMKQCSTGKVTLNFIHSLYLSKHNFF